MRCRRGAVIFANTRAITFFSDQFEGRLEKIHEQAHGTIEFGEKRRCFKTFEPAIANHPPNDGAILLLDEGLIVLLVRSATREDHSRLIAIRLQSLIHEYGVVVGVQSQKRKGQLLAQFGQHRTQQVLLPHEQGRAFRPSGRNIREDESLDETAARRGAAVCDEVGLHETRRRIIPIR